MVTTNPYSYSGPGTRWTDTQATTTSRLNISRVNNDYLHWFLTTALGIDSEGVLTLRPASSIVHPSTVLSGTDENGTRIISVDLDNPSQMWDLREFRQLSRNTSWYAEVGHMPLRMLIWIAADEASVQIYNREVMDTATPWMTFTAASNNMLHAAGAKDLQFLDGILYIGGDGTFAKGNALVDFVRDNQIYYTAGGVTQYKSTMDDRNAASGNLTMNSLPALIDSTVNAVDVYRDPLGAVDEFGRPKHRWVAGSDTGSSGSDAGAENIYDSGQTEDHDHNALLETGEYAIVIDQVARDLVHFSNSFQAKVTADGFGNDFGFRNDQAGGKDLPWVDAAIFSAVDLLPNASVASEGSAILLFSSDKGLAVSHIKPDNEGKDCLTFIIDNVAIWPPYSGAVGMSLALADVTELFGNDMTNNGIVTFVEQDGMPCANFVAASSQSLTDPDNAAHTPSTSAMSIGCWLKWDVDTGGVGIISKWDNNSAADQSYRIRIQGSNTIRASYVMTGPSLVNSDSPALSLDTWYHVAFTWDGTTQRLYLDGVEVDSDANAGTLLTATEPLTIGATSGTGAPADFFDGQIARVFVMGRAMTAAEVRDEYQRGLRIMQSSTKKLDSADVDYVQTDKKGRYSAFGNESKMYIADRYGTIVLTDTPANGNIQDVAVWSQPGADDPSYAMATTTRIETVQTNPKIGEVT